MVLGVLDPNFKTPSKGSILSLESTPFLLIPINAGSKAHEFPPMHPSSLLALLLKEQNRDALSNSPGHRVIKTDAWQTGNNVKIRFRNALQPSGANWSKNFIFSKSN